MATSRLAYVGRTWFKPSQICQALQFQRARALHSLRASCSSNKDAFDHTTDMETLERLQWEANQEADPELNEEVEDFEEQDGIDDDNLHSMMQGGQTSEADIDDAVPDDILLQGMLEKLSKMTEEERQVLAASLEANDDDGIPFESSHDPVNANLLSDTHEDAMLTPEMIQLMVEQKESSGFHLENEESEFSLHETHQDAFSLDQPLPQPSLHRPEQSLEQHDDEDEADLSDGFSLQSTKPPRPAKPVSKPLPAVEFSLGGMPEERVKAKEEWYRSVQHQRLSAKLYKALTQAIYEERLIDGIELTSVQFEEPMVNRSRSKCVFKWHVQDEADGPIVSELLRHNQGRLRHRLARRLDMKRFPKITFQLGKDKQMQAEMDELFEKMRKREDW
eukprot:m.56989 g.56989  ORF g.56989 m.56989 type:complete len:391 (+) comp13699_c1_seq6:1893-3065(+)